jgi:glyoxylase I family protein
MIPFNVEQIDHAVFRVRDLPKSVDFYRTVLGCEVVHRRDDLGLIHIRVGRSMVDLVSIDGKLGRQGGASAGASDRNVDHLCLRVEPFDEKLIVEHLVQQGVTPRGMSSSRYGAEGYGHSLYLEDPDGNVLELKGRSSTTTRGDA